MEVLKCDVTRPIRFVLFALSDECYALSNEADDRMLKFDRLGVNEN